MKTRTTEKGTHGIKRPDTPPKKNQLPSRGSVSSPGHSNVPLKNNRSGLPASTYLFFPRRGIFFLILLLLVAAGVTAPAAALFIQKPIPDFSANVRSGAAPLTVSFTDHSLYATGRAWFFGDENYTAPWTPMNASSGWSGRYSHASVVLPDGSIVLMGGNDYSSFYHDVWRSIDNGATWALVNASAGWSGRSYHRSVAMPDGSIVLTGGLNSTYHAMNDTWRSTDHGLTWTLMNASPGWSGRYGHSSVVMPDGSIVLMGGSDSSGFMNDVWRSTDDGATWTLVNASAGWSARYEQSSVVVPDGSIVLTGGSNSGGYKNDVWRSTDRGATWTRMNASAGWPVRDGHSSVVMPDGRIILMGGRAGSLYKHDVWQSTDKGATWTRLAGAGWSARWLPSSVVMPDGSIVLTGGETGSLVNDTWRLNPVGSSVKNPSHTYTTPGSYQVVLQAYNAVGSNSTRKIGYITVVAPPAVTSITPKSGPLAGNTGVTITGTGFTGVTSVRFGTTKNSTPLTVVSSTKITVKSPTHSAGTVDVRVITQTATSAIVAGDKFTYTVRPNVTGITPKSGPLAGNTVVTITGSGFSGATAVRFGSTKNTTPFSLVSPTRITVKSPAHAAAVTDVTVTTPGGTSAISTADRFTYT